MPKKRTPGLSDKEQSERFKETAREIGADESGKAFKRAFRKIISSKLPKGSQKPDQTQHPSNR